MSFWADLPIYGAYGGSIVGLGTEVNAIRYRCKKRWEKMKNVKKRKIREKNKKTFKNVRRIKKR